MRVYIQKYQQVVRCTISPDFGDNRTAMVINKAGIKEIGPGSRKDGKAEHTEYF